MSAHPYKPKDSLADACQLVMEKFQISVAVCVNKDRDDLLIAMQTCLGQIFKDASDALAAGKKYKIKTDEGTVH